MYLLDTNVISERLKPKPNTGVVRWLDAHDDEGYYLSVLTLGEIRKGIELQGDHRKKLRYIAWLEHSLPAQFVDRILGIDAHVADQWGRMIAKMTGTIQMIDSLIAATALVHNLSVVTRNEKDFSLFPVEVINPWKSTS